MPPRANRSLNRFLEGVRELPAGDALAVELGLDEAALAQAGRGATFAASFCIAATIANIRRRPAADTNSIAVASAR